MQTWEEWDENGDDGEETFWELLSVDESREVLTRADLLEFDGLSSWSVKVIEKQRKYSLVTGNYDAYMKLEVHSRGPGGDLSPWTLSGKTWKHYFWGVLTD